MAKASIFGKFLGNSLSGTISYAAGVATGPVLGPVVQALRNTVNSQYSFVYPDPGTLAEGVAQGQVPAKDARLWASYHGIGDDAFTALVNIANVGPGSGFAFDLWRRGVIEEPAFRRALKRLGLEQEWIDDLVKIKGAILSPQELAVMAQRGIVPNAQDPNGGGTLLPVGPPTAVGKVPPMPGIDIDPVAEAAGHGVNFQRLAGLTRIIGLPASPDLAARMTFRGIIDRPDFDRAISEGNTRNEWAPFLFDGFREILTAHQWVELHLRGYISAAEMHTGTALHGMSVEDTDRLYEVSGRPLTVHQITTALARGAKFNPIGTELPDPYDASVHESNIKPSYYEMAKANKYSYPSLFQLNNLVKGGAITAAIARDWAHKNGYAPEVLDAMHAFWLTEEAGKPAVNTQSALSGAARAVGRSYANVNITKAQAEADLAGLGVSDTEAADLFAAWDVQRTARLQGLSNAQVRAAYRKRALTLTDALPLLETHGLTADAATSYLTAGATAAVLAAIKKGIGTIYTYDDAVAELVSLGYTSTQITAALGPRQ